MVLLSQCDFRSDRGLELHFSEEQRPVGVGAAERFQTRQERKQGHFSYCNFMGNYSFVVSSDRKHAICSVYALRLKFTFQKYEECRSTPQLKWNVCNQVCS